MELFTKYSKKTVVQPTSFLQYLSNDLTFLRVVQVHQQKLCNVRSNILLESEAGAGDTPCGDHLTTSHISPDIKKQLQMQGSAVCDGKCILPLYTFQRRVSPFTDLLSILNRWFTGRMTPNQRPWGRLECLGTRPRSQ